MKGRVRNQIWRLSIRSRRMREAGHKVGVKQPMEEVLARLPSER
jgi:hypothetical protein